MITAIVSAAGYEKSRPHLRTAPETANGESQSDGQILLTQILVIDDFLR